MSVQPRAVAPYFVVVALIHAGAVATRFDVVAAQLPPGAAAALMVVQFPLLVLSGYFESRLDYGAASAGMPLWMRIRSRPVKLAFTFAFIYLACVALQTWHVSIGPLDPTPPLAWPTAQRALWFAMFTAGMAFPFYLAATSLLVPVLRVIVRPLRGLPAALAGALALVVGAVAGAIVLAALTSQRIGAFVDAVQAALHADPALAVAVTLVTTLGPLALGILFGSGRGDDDG